tara:strand:- start:581 stop:1234 length:654 start_codon:yes stop_codon:yes gene_type:complete
MNEKIILTNDGSHSLFSPKINESYHSKYGAIVEAEHVFIRNGFSTVKKSNLNILEVGFGTGLNALLTYQKATQKGIQVNYHTIELYPIDKKTYLKLNFTDLIGLEKKDLSNLHNCPWEKKQKINPYFSLTKNHTSLEKYKTDIKFDIIYFDAFSPEKQPELWSHIIFEKMHKILKNDGFLVTYCAKGIIKRTMKYVGFKIIVLDGPPGKRQMTRGNK